MLLSLRLEAISVLMRWEMFGDTGFTMMLFGVLSKLGCVIVCMLLYMIIKFRKWSVIDRLIYYFKFLNVFLSWICVKFRDIYSKLLGNLQLSVSNIVHKWLFSEFFIYFKFDGLRFWKRNKDIRVCSPKSKNTSLYGN